jgi:hypothetical protein
MAIALDRPSVATVAHALTRDRVCMPAPEVVTRELGVESWVLTLGPDGALRGVTVLGPPRAAPSPRAALGPPSGASPLDRRYPLDPHGALARIVGDVSATGRQLADLALRRDDPAARGEAVRVAVDAMMDDPALEQALLAALDGVDDATLARTVANVAGEASAALVSLVATRASGHPLGRRAARVLERLGPGG